MSFFEQSESPERPPPSRRPAWLAPPDNEIGVAFPINLGLGRTGEVALALVSGIAYSTGVSLRLNARLHPDLPIPRGPLFMPGDADGLRFGVEYSDGRKATNQAPRRPPDVASAVRMTQSGGSGGGSSWEFAYWLNPLPPPGEIAFAAKWVARGVVETVHVLDAGPILEATARSEQLWPDDRPPAEDGARWTRYA